MMFIGCEHCYRVSMCVMWFETVEMLLLLLLR